MLKISKKIWRKNGENKSFQFQFQLLDTNPPSNNVKCDKKASVRKKLAEENIRQNVATQIGEILQTLKSDLLIK